MPAWMRIAILGFFALVFVVPATQMCFGTVLVGGMTAATVAEFAPTPEDFRVARELQARADAIGVPAEVTPVQIALARRTGEMEEIEAVFDELEARAARGRGSFEAGDAEGEVRSVLSESEPTMAGTYQPGSRVEAEAPDDGLWLWAGLAFLALFAFLAAIGFALQSVFSGPDAAGDEPPA